MTRWYRQKSLACPRQALPDRLCGWQSATCLARCNLSRALPGTFVWRRAAASGLIPPKPAEVAYPVELATIDRKVIWFDRTDSTAQMIPEQRGWIFVEYPDNLP